MIREDILQKFPDLFGKKKVNGRDVSVEDTIDALTRELDPEIVAALSARRALLPSPAPAAEKYAWPRWDEAFEDPVSGKPWTYRQIVQGLVDNFLGRDTPLRWRLNDEVPIPDHVHPSRNPGLELTGPWAPLDMAFNALNSAAPMNMPDFEDASPSAFPPRGLAGRPAGGRSSRPCRTPRRSTRGAGPAAPTRWRRRGRSAPTASTGRRPGGRRAWRGRPASTYATTTSPWTESLRPASSSSRPSGRSTTTTRSTRAGQRRLLLHPQDPDAARGAHRRAAAGAAGGA